MDTPGAVPRRPTWGRLLTVAGAALLAAVLVGIALRAAGEPRAVAASLTRADPVTTTLSAPGVTPAPTVSAAPMLAPAQDVLVLGDSLALSTYPWLADLMPDREVHWEARVGRTTTEARLALAARALTGNLPPVIVVSSGTNDVDAAVLRREAARILDLAGPRRCVVWSDVVRPADFADGTAAANVALETAWQGHRNVVAVGWAAMIRNHPDWLTSDGVHATEAGNIARARAFAEAVFSCSPFDPSAPVAAQEYLPYASFLAPGGGSVPGVGIGGGAEDETGNGPSSSPAASRSPAVSTPAPSPSVSATPSATQPSGTPSSPEPSEPVESATPAPASERARR